MPSPKTPCGPFGFRVSGFVQWDLSGESFHQRPLHDPGSGRRARKERGTGGHWLRPHVCPLTAPFKYGSDGGTALSQLRGPTSPLGGQKPTAATKSGSCEPSPASGPQRGKCGGRGLTVHWLVRRGGLTSPPRPSTPAGLIGPRACPGNYSSEGGAWVCLHSAIGWI